MNEAIDLSPGDIFFGFAEGIMHERPYTNWKGERAVRTFIPSAIYWGANEWHPAPQWLMAAWDVEKDAMRTFALNGFLEGTSS